MCLAIIWVVTGLEVLAQVFSSSLYMCRYCLVQKDKSGLSATAEIRTPENYDTALVSVSGDNSFEGIIKQSVLNTL